MYYTNDPFFKRGKHETMPLKKAPYRRRGL
jgi:hypothetical protein